MDQSTLAVIGITSGVSLTVLAGISSWVSWKSYQFLKQQPKSELDAT